MALEKGHRVYALSFNYGQRHGIELIAAAKLAHVMGVEDHMIADLDLAKVTRSALTGQLEVPKHDSIEDMSGDIGDKIPDTYVPARNILFITIAAARAEAVGASDIYLGINALDYSGYPDCRPEFIEAMQHTLNVGTKQGVEGNPFTLHAPLIHMTKAEIIREGTRLGVDYSLTRSCYDPDENGLACGHCDSCLLRKRGFTRAGIPDPTQYA